MMNSIYNSYTDKLFAFYFVNNRMKITTHWLKKGPSYLNDSGWIVVIIVPNGDNTNNKWK